MKLVCYSARSGPAAGVLGDDGIRDAAAVFGLPAGSIRDVQALLEAGPDVLDRLSAALAATDVEVVPGAALRAPLLQPPAIRDFVGFAEHVRRAGARVGLAGQPDASWYADPVFYFSNPSTVVGPGETVCADADAAVDYEVELGFVIGAECCDVDAAAGLASVAGVTLYNDWSDRARCGPEKAGFGFHKAKDFAQGLGPWVLTLDEVADRLVDGRLDLRVQARVDGRLTTDANTGGIHWSIGEMVAYASRHSRLRPGDVLGTGTVPGGCLWEDDGDADLPAGTVVEITGERLGTLRQEVRRS